MSKVEGITKVVPSAKPKSEYQLATELATDPGPSLAGEFDKG